MQDFEPIMPLSANASLSDELAPLLMHIAAVVQLFLAYPNWNAVRTELSWTHYRLLLRMDNLYARSGTKIAVIETNRLPYARNPK